MGNIKHIPLERVEKFMSVIEKETSSKIYTLGKSNKDLSLKRVSTGSAKYDEILGGGRPRGRVMEVYGPESSGKTTTCLIMAAETTRQGGHVLFVDCEQALDISYGKKLGINFYDESKKGDDSQGYFFLTQPDYGEQAMNVVVGAIQSGMYDLIIVDSVAAMIPQSLLSKDAQDEGRIGELARMMSRGCAKITSYLGQNPTPTVVFINQERDKIGGFMGYGEQKTTTGGNALKFYSSIRVEVRKGAPITRGEDRVGAEIRLKTIKNKTTAPYKQTTINLMFDEKLNNYGIDAEQEIVDAILDKDILGTRGRYTGLLGESIKSCELEINGDLVKVDGKGALAHYLKNNKEELKYIYEEVIKKDIVNLSQLGERDEEGRFLPYLEYCKENNISVVNEEEQEKEKAKKETKKKEEEIKKETVEKVKESEEKTKK